MASQSRIRLPYALRDGRLVHISEVVGGRSCNCTCPSCGESLIARKGQEKVHHFAHEASECTHGLQTAMHLAAKEILDEERRMWLPALRIERTGDGPHGPVIVKREIGRDQMVVLEDVVLERKLDQVIPDLSVRIKGKPLLIEIAVTHFVDTEKLARIRAMGLPVLEVDLSGLDRSAAIDVIREAVIFGEQCKSWLYTPKAEGVDSELEHALQQEIERQKQKHEQRMMKYLEAQKQKKLATVARKRATRRQQLGPELNQLLEFAKPDFQAELRRHYADDARRTDAWQWVEERLGITFDQIPAHLDVSVADEMAFTVDRRVWQSAIFTAFIFNKPRFNKPFEITDVITWCFGSRLIHGFIYSLFCSAWILTEAERELFPDPSVAIRAFLYSLSDGDFLISLGNVKKFGPEAFRVIHRSLEALLTISSADVTHHSNTPVRVSNRVQNPAKVLRLAEEIKVRGADYYICRLCRVPFVYPKGIPHNEIICLGCGSHDIEEDRST